MARLDPPSWVFPCSRTCTQSEHVYVGVKGKIKSMRGGWGTRDYRRRSFGRPAGISRSPSQLHTQGVTRHGRSASGLRSWAAAITYRSVIAVAFGVGAAADHPGQQSLSGLPPTLQGQQSLPGLPRPDSLAGFFARWGICDPGASRLRRFLLPCQLLSPTASRLAYSRCDLSHVLLAGNGALPW